MKNFEHDFILPPFPGFPSTNRFVPLGPVLDTLTRVSRSILAREAISLIIGPPGTGKSLVCALLAKEFASSHDVVVLGETPIADVTSFYRFLLHRLGVALESGKRDDLELMIHDRLCGADANPDGAILLVDEATSLSTEILEAIRRLTNLMRDGQPMVTAVVAGGVQLDETLTAPSMESFVQRVTARCYLHPLNAQEAREYIRESIQACDASADETITDGALSAIYHASSGVPRLINQLMTEAIDCAADLDESRIDEHTVNKAWASLQQLPSPMTEEPSMRSQSSSVEFGELVDPLPITQASGSAGQIKSELFADSIRRAEQEADAIMADTPGQRDVLQQDMGRPVTQALDPFALFGEFEDEEKIEVGAANVKAIPLDSPSFDLESMLHSQIVSLSQFAAENTTSRYSDLDSLSMFKECPADEIDADQVANEIGDLETEFPSVIWYDEPVQEQNDDGSEAALHDDSDLLWITEDIDVDRRSGKPAAVVSPRRVDQPAQPDAPKLNVDYREMLDKMRNQA